LPEITGLSVRLGCGPVRTNTCPVFSAAKTEVLMQLENFAMACAPKHVRFSSAHEHATNLGAAAPAPSNTVVINARCSLRIEADRRVIVIAGPPVHHYRAEDAVAEAYAMVLLVESGFAQQTDVAGVVGRGCRP
jgi:hypothetical protein